MTATPPDPSPVRTPRPRPSALRTVLLVAGFSILRGIRGRRLAAVVSIVALPCLLGLIVGKIGGDSGPSPREQAEFYYGLLSAVHMAIVVPCVALAMSTAFPWPEAEDGTLTYWFTAPAWRWAIQLGRYIANVVIGSVFLPIAFIGAYLPLTFPEGQDGWPVAIQGVIGTLLAFPAYVAIFSLMTTVFRRGFLFGVGFMVLENSLALVQGNIQSLTLIHYERAYVWASIPTEMRRFVQDVYLVDLRSPVAATSDALMVFAIVPVLALALGLVVVQVIEYRAKQGQSA